MDKNKVIIEAASYLIDFQYFCTKKIVPTKIINPPNLKMNFVKNVAPSFSIARKTAPTLTPMIPKNRTRKVFK